MDGWIQYFCIEDGYTFHYKDYIRESVNDSQHAKNCASSTVHHYKMLTHSAIDWAQWN